MELFDVAGLFQFLDDTRKVAAAAVLEVHAMGDFANAGRLGIVGEVGNDFFACDDRGVRLLVFDGVLASHEMGGAMDRPIDKPDDRLADFADCGKK